MICDITNGSVNSISSALCHIPKSGYTGCDAWKQHHNTSKNTLKQCSNAMIQGNVDFLFFELVGTIN